MDYGWLVLLLGGDFGVDGLEGALDEAAVGSVEGGVWSEVLIFLKNRNEVENEVNHDERKINRYNLLQ